MSLKEQEAVTQRLVDTILKETNYKKGLLWRIDDSLTNSFVDVKADCSKKSRKYRRK